MSRCSNRSARRAPKADTEEDGEDIHSDDRQKNGQGRCQKIEKDRPQSDVFEVLQRTQHQYGHIDTGKEKRHRQHLQKGDEGGTDDLLLQCEFRKEETESAPKESRKNPEEDQGIGGGIFLDFMYQNGFLK